MRESTKQTTVAVLRSIIGVKADEMARILQCSIHSINSLESKGRLKLSEKLARRMCHETGISLAWLLEGDPKVPPVTENGEPFVRETYERAQSLKTRRDTPKEWNFSVRFLALAGQLRAVLMRASAQRDFTLASYQIRKFLNSLAVKYGAPKTGRDPELAHRPIEMILPTDAKAMRADLAKLESSFPFLTKRKPLALRARQSSGHEKRT